MEQQPNEIVTVRSPAEVQTKQRLSYFVGISGASAGSRNLSLSLLVVPPGGAAEPHVHQGYETAIYVLEGRVETHYGEGLKQSVVNEAGDFMFIPPGLPHQPINLSQETPAKALVARNDSNEQERTVLYELPE